MVVVHAEDVGPDDALAQDADARVDVVRVDVGELLEDGQRHQDLAHAARVLVLPALPLGIARVVPVREIEHRDAVALVVGADQLPELFGQRGIRLRELEVRLLRQAQIHHREGQQLARGALAPLQPALLDHTLMKEPCDAGALVAVQRIGAYGALEYDSRKPGAGDDAAAHETPPLPMGATRGRSGLIRSTPKG